MTKICVINYHNIILDKQQKCTQGFMGYLYIVKSWQKPFPYNCYAFPKWPRPHYCLSCPCSDFFTNDLFCNRRNNMMTVFKFEWFQWYQTPWWLIIMEWFQNTSYFHRMFSKPPETVSNYQNTFRAGLFRECPWEPLALGKHVLCETNSDRRTSI